MKVERSVKIASPPEAVYGVIMDPHRLADWVTIHERLGRAPEGALTEGAELEQSLKVAGRRFDVEWKVTEAQPPSRVTWEGRGPMGTRARVVYRLEPIDDGTDFSYLNEYQLPGGALGAMAGRAVSGRAARETERTLERLKSLIEGGG